MIGDYCRYKTETLEFKPEKREEVCKEATKCYEDANAVNLGPCTATRLGLILNMSVFYYEICKEHKKAAAIGEAALTVALEKVDDLAEAEFQEAKPLIEQLKENL
jgi:14-3-3 protein epsilon